MLIDNMKMKLIRFTYQVPIDFGISDTSLTVDIPIWGKDYVFGIYGRVKTAFVGATVTMRIGTSNNDESIMPAKNLSQTGNLMSHLEYSLGAKCIYGAMPEVRYNDTVPVITFTSSDNNLSSLTAGEVELILARIILD